MSAKAKPSAVRAARDRAVQAMKAEKVTRLEYRRRHKRADADPQMAGWWKAHNLGMKTSGKVSKSYFRLRDKVEDRLAKKYGTGEARVAWWAACRELRRAVKDLFRRPSREMGDMLIKARFWRSLSKAGREDALDLQYMTEDAVHWFNDGIIKDLESGIG